MNSVPRNVILDLLPVYIAGEASEETRALVEDAARDDDEIAGIIRSGLLGPDAMSQGIRAPEALEMKTIRRVRRSIRRRMAWVAIATVAILLIPLVAMQFTGEVDWSPADFIGMGILLLGAGLGYVLLTSVSENSAYRAAAGVAVVTGLLLVWMNLAVGIIGSEDNPANQLYFAVILIGVVGAGIARFRPRGMARAMFATAAGQFLVPIIAMLIWTPSLDDLPGIAGVFLLNTFFVALYIASGMLFRHAARKERAA